jgi:argininosuccinate lyase
MHTALERRLTAMIGEAGKRVHLGRSRNDQLLAALRLYLLDAVETLQRNANAVARELDALGTREADTALPGYTHMQQAMPSSVHLWAAGFAAEIRDDIAALSRTRSRISKNPLGSAAGYGVPGLPIDRDSTRRSLGFDAIHEPVTAVQLSRGKAEAGVVLELCLLMQDLSRLAADLLLFYTQEFAFIGLPANMTTGSSIMPQKRNPDVLELVRGASATVQACLAEILNLPARLPSGYQRDLQRLKSPLFRAIDLSSESCLVMALYSAGRANRLVLEEGISFRDAYRRVSEELQARKAAGNDDSQ